MVMAIETRSFPYKLSFKSRPSQMPYEHACFQAGMLRTVRPFQFKKSQRIIYNTTRKNVMLLQRLTVFLVLLGELIQLISAAVFNSIILNENLQIRPSSSHKKFLDEGSSFRKVRSSSAISSQELFKKQSSNNKRTSCTASSVYHSDSNSQHRRSNPIIFSCESLADLRDSMRSYRFPHSEQFHGSSHKYFLVN